MSYLNLSGELKHLIKHFSVYATHTMDIEQLFNDPWNTLDEWIPDTFAFDFDRNGVVDFELRNTGDSIIPNQLLYNVDSKGGAEVVFEINLTEDNIPVARVKTDLDHDGNYDLALADLNGDWWPDLVSVDIDSDGDMSRPLPTSSTGGAVTGVGINYGLEAWGEIDEQMSTMPSSDEASSKVFAFGEKEDFPPADLLPRFEQHDNLINRWADEWHLQQGTSTCGICCQEFILEESLGRDISESELVDKAKELGVYHGNGTSIADMGALLDHYGVDNDITFHCNFDHLKNVVGQGHGVIVAVDSNEIWGSDEWSDISGIPLCQSNHAIQVIAVEVSDGQELVVVNDPGIANGQGLRIPVTTFLDAWHDSERAACVTKKPVIV